MYKKIVVLIFSLFISGCKRVEVSSELQQKAKHVGAHVHEKRSGLWQKMPRKSRVRSSIKPIEKMAQLADLIEEHLELCYKPKDLLVIFDIDETLLASYAAKEGLRKQFLAHDLYPFVADTILLENIPEVRLKKIGKENIHINKKGLNRYVQQELIDTAHKKAYKAFSLLHRKGALETQPTEDVLGEFIDNVQKMGVKVMGLTARGVDMKSVTFDELKHAGIDLGRYTLSKEDRIVKNHYHGFNKGILFTTPGAPEFDKGELLMQLFKDINYKPQVIIFIDDNLHFVESVQKALGKVYPHVVFNGLWYTIKKKNEFDRELAEEIVNSVLGSSWKHLETQTDFPAKTIGKSEGVCRASV